MFLTGVACGILICGYITKEDCFRYRPRYDLVVDEDVKKPTNQPNTRFDFVDALYP